MSVNLASLVIQVSANVDKATSQLQNLQRHLLGLRDVVKTAAGFMAGMIGYRVLDAVQTFVAGSVESFSDFEQKLKNIQVFAGLTTEEAARLGRTLLEMSSESVFSVSELQDSMIDLARAGIVGEDALKMLQAGMVGAMAAGENLDSTINVALQAIRAFGLSIEDSNRVMDILINAANISQASVADLGTALSYVGPIAASAGISLEDMSAAIAYLTNVGFDASMAGTYLRGVISDLLNPTKTAREEMERLGISIYDSQGKLKSFPEILSEFRNKLAGLGDAEITQVLMRIFDTRSATAMAALIHMNENAWDDLRSAIDETGVAEKQASEMMDTYAGAMKRLQATMEAARVELGEALAPLIEKATSLFIKFLPHISRVVGYFAEMGSRILDYVSPAVDTLLGRMNELSKSPTWSRIQEVAGEAFSRVQKWFEAVVSDPRIQKIIDLLGSIVDKGINIILNAVETLMKAWDEDWGGIRTTMETVGNKVIDILVELFGWIDGIASFILDHWPDVEETIKNVLDGIKGAIETVLGPFQKLWDIITGLQKVKLPSLPSFSIPGITAGAAPTAPLTPPVGGLAGALGAATGPAVNLTIDVHDNRISDEIDESDLARRISEEMIDGLRRYGVIP